jgi:hypothetical protein
MLSAIGSTKGEALGQDVLARHMSTKHHSWRGKYQRVWAIKKECLQHADPADFSVTNVWPWDDVVVRSVTARARARNPRLREGSRVSLTPMIPPCRSLPQRSRP